MKRALTAFSCLAFTAGMLTFATAPAQAATGEVVVFELEATPVTVYDNPSGCVKLPAAAHVLTNRTDGDVTIYGDPFCLTPGLVVAPGYGTHVAAGSGSFSA